jgi:hypothetical protein
MFADIGLGSRIVKQVLWQPVVQPPPMSIARQVAYSNRVADIPGLERDPQGWHTLEAARISGQIFGQRTVEVEYTVRGSLRFPGTPSY